MIHLSCGSTVYDFVILDLSCGSGA